MLAVNTDTNQQFETTTNKDGSYNISSLPVGPYRMQIEKVGFRTILKEGLFLHTQDALQINYQMAVGSTSETVTVSSDSNNINTTDATVSTTIDRQFVENIPMNGRSFQTLVLLSPGVTTSTPQGNTLGEYSVNGMRGNANNYSVDGASASNPASYNSGAGSAGMAPSETALGTTQSMIGVDAMEEFRVATSTYSAEYGRSPGAQVSFRSRSGTNEYHGTAYDYLRNYAFDANNWFNTYATTPLPTPAERQNDFGGTLGGPISIPHLYSGKDRTFFFFAYEGLRLNEPQPASIFYVPSNGTYNTGTYTNDLYKNMRANAPAAEQPMLNAWPLPNCSTAIDPQCVDYANGVSPYIQTPPSTGTINSISARIDYQLLPSMRLFARYSDVTSNSLAYNTNGPDISRTVLRNRVYLLGADNTFGGTLSNELRLQYAPAYYDKTEVPSQANGASNINMNTVQGLPPVGGETWVEMFSTVKSIMYQQSYGSLQFQPNATDTVTWSHGNHLFKAGVDYRQTTAYYGDGPYSRGPYATYNYTSNPGKMLLANQPATTATTYLRTDPTTKNMGLFLQDEWHLLPRLSLSLGLRWDINPPPSVSGAQMYTYTGSLNNPSSLQLSQQGAPLYHTTWTDFAPRVGVAWTLRDQPGHELVLRTGGGLFYDSISLQQTFGAGYGLSFPTRPHRSAILRDAAGAVPTTTALIFANLFSTFITKTNLHTFTRRHTFTQRI